MVYAMHGYKPYFVGLAILSIFFLAAAVGCTAYAIAMRKWHYVTATSLLAFVYAAFAGILIVLVSLIP